MSKAETPLWAPAERARGLRRPRSLAANPPGSGPNAVPTFKTAARFPAGFPEVPRAICTIRCEEAQGRRSAPFASLPLLRPSGYGGAGGTRKRASAPSFARRRRPDRILFLLPRQIPAEAPELLPCSALPSQETYEGPGRFPPDGTGRKKPVVLQRARGDLGPPAGCETRKGPPRKTLVTKRLPAFRPKIIRTSSNDQAGPGI